MACVVAKILIEPGAYRAFLGERGLEVSWGRVSSQ